MTRSTHKVFQICSIIALVKRMSTNLMICWMLSEWIEYTDCVESLTQFSKYCLNILDSKPTYFAFMPGLYLVKSISRKRRRKGQDGRDADDGTGNCKSGPNLRKCIFGDLLHRIILRTLFFSWSRIMSKNESGRKLYATKEVTNPADWQCCCWRRYCPSWQSWNSGGAAAGLADLPAFHSSY